MRKLCVVVLGMAFGAACFGQSDASSHPAGGPGFQAMVKDAKTRIREMNVSELKAMRASGEKFTLIDVREDTEWAAGHAAGAVHLSKGLIEHDIEAKMPEKNAKLVLYCGGGARSALAADALMKMGYTNVYSLAGGLGAYKAEGLQVEK
jgi:rhodanese-related sulfurtransferase